MPTPESLRALVGRYCEAVSSGSVERVVALFAPDAVQADPASAPPNVGREAIGSFFAAAFEAAERTTFEALAVHTSGSSVAIDFKVTVDLGGGQMTITGIEVFTVGDDDLIVRVDAYWDDADVTVG